MVYSLALILLLASKKFSTESLTGDDNTFVFLENRICVKLRHDLELSQMNLFVYFRLSCLSTQLCDGCPMPLSPNMSPFGIAVKQEESPYFILLNIEFLSFCKTE